MVHICTEVSDALEELPALCGGDLSTPQASGLGTNASSSDKQVPKAVIFGGRSTDEEFEEMSSAITDKAPDVRIVRITREDLIDAGVPLPPPGTIPTGPPPPGSAPPPEVAEAITAMIKGKLEGL